MGLRFRRMEVAMERFFAKLLFQFRKTKKGKEQKRRLCEERIITILAKSDEDAYKKAVAYGKKSAFIDDRGHFRASFEFIGILDMDSLFDKEGGDIEEVYWNIIEMVEPMERKDKIVPPKNKLPLFRKEIPERKGRVKYG